MTAFVAAPAAGFAGYGGLLGSWVEGWAATAGRGQRTACRPSWRIAPWSLDVARWMSVTSRAQAPEMGVAARDRVRVAAGAAARLLGSGSARGVVPTLVLPPQAGHDSCIVDYSPEQSQMRTIVASGLSRALHAGLASARRARPPTPRSTTTST